MIQSEYFFSKHEDVITSIRQSEQDFHSSHIPLYANYLFCNSFMMSKIANYLANPGPESEVTRIRLFEISEDECERLDKGTVICGMELVNGKVDFEANYQIAQYSQNVLIYAMDSINGDDLVLVYDNNLSDNRFILKYIPDNDDEDDTETVYSPDEKRILTLV